MANNAAYWSQRMKLMEEALLDRSYSYVENMERQFALAQAEIEKELAAWYSRFAANNELTLADAKRLLTGRELEEFRWTVGEYIAYGQQNALDGTWMKQLENASARVHISRLEAIQLQLQQQAEQLYANQLDLVDAAVREAYLGSYYHTAFEVQRGLGVGWTMQAIHENAIAKVLSRPWTTDGKTFRDRCWTNKEALVNSVNTQLTHMIIRGEAPDKAIEAIAHQFEVSRAKAGRLVMTEAAAFSSAAQKDCYKDLDVERYTWICSFDKDTCQLCGSMDGQVFKLSDYQVGLTAPPAHPWCRCCTAPYFEDMEGLGERWSRNPDGTTEMVPGDMTFEEWREEFLSDGENGLKSEGNSDILQIRGMAMGLRRPVSHILTEDEIAGIKADAEAIGINPAVLRFNAGGQTGFSDATGLIHIRGDILPDLSSPIPRDCMSQRAVLAHEYYGHYLHAHAEIQYPVGDWHDEFRASYSAAVNTPNLTDEDRRYLMLDAYDRQKEAGAFEGYDEVARRIIYGY